ncbi:MAG: hypothetical protein IKQ25_03740, partial [Lachnospiraceae bacterium]|nr:hypothetical protein [Lachnospiraceae bacterium]
PEATARDVPKGTPKMSENYEIILRSRSDSKGRAERHAEKCQIVCPKILGMLKKGRSQCGSEFARMKKFIES